MKIIILFCLNLILVKLFDELKNYEIIISMTLFYHLFYHLLKSNHEKREYLSFAIKIKSQISNS